MSKKISIQTKQVGIYFPKPFYRNLKQYLDKTGQNFNGYIKGLIVNDLKEKGILNLSNNE